MDGKVHLVGGGQEGIPGYATYRRRRLDQQVETLGGSYQFYSLKRRLWRLYRTTTASACLACPLLILCILRFFIGMSRLGVSFKQQ